MPDDHTVVAVLAAQLYDLFREWKIELAGRLIYDNARVLRAVKVGHPNTPMLFRVLCYFSSHSNLADEVARRLAREYLQDGGGYSRRAWCQVELGQAVLALHDNRGSNVVEEHCNWVHANAEA